MFLVFFFFVSLPLVQIRQVAFEIRGAHSENGERGRVEARATRYTAKHKLIAVCRAMVVIYRQPTTNTTDNRQATTDKRPSQCRSQ